jgi:hypothetical protein
MWRLLGLNVRSSYQLGPAVPHGSAADVVVARGQGEPPVPGAQSQLVAGAASQARAAYALYHLKPGYLLRFEGSWDFVLDERAELVQYWASSQAKEGLVPVLLSGTVASVLLTLRGYPVLHGSAVNWRGLTVVFVGSSGRGKSTLAALCCAAGARFVCEDVVPLVEAPPPGGGVASRGLSYELRLRPAATEVLQLFPPPGPARRPTADGRTALRPPLAANEVNVLSAVVVPRPDRSAKAVALRHLGAAAAVKVLLANARVPAMSPLCLQRPYFELASALAAAVPVVEATVPWGPPFKASTALELLGQLGAFQG